MLIKIVGQLSKLKRLSRAERPKSALLLLRFAFFMLLAYDLWLISLSHAPRYGAGNFNVSHLDLLGTLFVTPTPSAIGAIYLAAGSISIWVAVGLVGRWGVLCTASLYTFAYYWSQADSYQHHYLLCLCLFLFLGEPWRASKKQECIDLNEADHDVVKREIERAEGMCSGLTLDAIMWQMALIYGWTAMAKCEPVWLSGETLSKIVSNPEVRQVVESSGAWIGLNAQETFAWSAWGVMLGEWFAAIAFVCRPLRSFAFFVIPWFHVMVEWIGFDIELFSYYMILLNIALLSPAVFWRPLDRCLGLQMKASRRRVIKSTSAVWLVTLSLSLGSALTLYSIELEGAILAAFIAAICLFISTLDRSYSIKTGWTFALALLFSMSAHLFLRYEVSASTFRFDYYRMWGGDLKRRGELKEALEVYRLANKAQAPDQAARFVQAGELALRLGQEERGLEELAEGARRRLSQLEHLLVEVLETQDASKKILEFNRAMRSAQSAQQKIYRAYLQRRDPRAEEAKLALDAISSMSQQVRMMR